MKKRFGFFIILTCLLVLCLGMNVQAANKKTVDCKKHIFKVSISLSGTWKISSNSDWLTAKKSGSKLKITVKGNTSSAKRTGTITVKSKKGKVKYKVIQKAYNVITYSYDYDWLTAAKRWNKTDVTKSFLKKTAKIADKLGVDADDLMTVMAFESGLNHKAVNKYSNATGLIQFMPSTAISLGTTVKKLKKMSAVKQLDYVYKYLARSGKLSNLGDLYMAILWPVAIGKKDSYVLWRVGTTYYTGNIGLDTNKDGKVTRKECIKRVLATRKIYVGE